MKEISMQNDEHGPVDTSRLCFVGCFSNSVFSALTSLHLSLPLHLPFLFCVSFSASLVSVSVPALLPQASKATLKVAEPASGLAPSGLATVLRLGRPVPPRPVVALSR